MYTLSTHDVCVLLNYVAGVHRYLRALVADHRRDRTCLVPNNKRRLSLLERILLAVSLPWIMFKNNLVPGISLSHLERHITLPMNRLPTPTYASAGMTRSEPAGLARRHAVAPAP